MSAAKRSKQPAVHPGEILRRDFLEGCGISQTALAVKMGVSPRRINEIVHGLRSITAETAVLLEEVLATPAAYWMGLQASFDIERARKRGVGSRVRHLLAYGLDPDEQAYQEARRRGLPRRRNRS